LAAENIALRQSLIVLKRKQKRPALKGRDPLFWELLSRIWPGWRDVVHIVQPDTVVRWHKRAFKRYWRRKSERGKRGRPSTDSEIRSIVLKMGEENPLWGAPTIRGELLKLGINISERTVSKLIRKHTPKAPSQTWRTFIKNHMTDMVAIDFHVVPTIRFRMLYVFIILSRAHRRVVHFNVTANPTAAWTAQQIVEAFPWDTAPRHLLRDRDSVYGEWFRRRVQSMGIEEVITSYHRPWKNPYVERLHGSIRRECTGSRYCLWRKPSAQNPPVLLQVLSPRPKTFGARQRNTHGASSLESGIAIRQIGCVAARGRASSSIRVERSRVNTTRSIKREAQQRAPDPNIRNPLFIPNPSVPMPWYRMMGPHGMLTPAIAPHLLG
jgi:putative transposase